MLDRVCDRGKEPVAQEAVLQVNGWCVSPNEVVEVVLMVGWLAPDREEAPMSMTEHAAAAVAAAEDRAPLRRESGVS